MNEVLVSMLILAGLVFFVVARTAVVVPQQSAYVVERLGRYHATLNAGFHILVPFVDVIRYQHSLKEQAMDIPAQVCITRDNVQVHVDGVLYMQVIDPEHASYGVADYLFAISQLAQTTLRSEIGKIDLDRTFEERANINFAVVQELDKASEPWGIKVLRYEIKNINPPHDVVSAMEKQMRAEREKRAVVLTSEGERDAKINSAEGDKQRVIKASEALRQQLNKLLEELKKRGMGQPGQQGQPGQPGGEMGDLGRAGDAMGDAQGSLGEGNADGAVDSQGRALEALRKGAQGMAQSMQQQMGQGQGPGQPGRTGQARANGDTDPLGRPLRGRDFGDDLTVKIPGEIDVQRVRRILELPVEYEDERLSSRAVELTAGRAKPSDDLAAAFLLQQFIDRRRFEAAHAALRDT